MRVPTDIHERGFDLTSDIVNTWGFDDARARWKLYEELRDYCESIAAAGRDHPFLWETLADFTIRALPLATAAGATAYEASIHLALAERHSRLGKLSVAYDHAIQANELASRTDDLDLRRHVSQFLLDHSRTEAGN